MTIIQQLAKAYVERAATLQLKGKARDNDLIAFWEGASRALILTGNQEDGEWVNRVGWLLLCVRGYSEVERIVSEIGKEVA